MEVEVVLEEVVVAVVEVVVVVVVVIPWYWIQATDAFITSHYYYCFHWHYPHNVTQDGAYQWTDYRYSYIVTHDDDDDDDVVVVINGNVYL